eukprot:TRINITY_DN1582_c0_g1_i4.p3 TRINITY_DN1582_c0_g1~~TRINITY_DN1582_c0_g1_i4.p3  ORF type:complete len:177 (+),score=47.31 TRINITY_DN1582_c0_g1_i4:606-1136(+)
MRGGRMLMIMMGIDDGNRRNDGHRGDELNYERREDVNDGNRRNDGRRVNDENRRNNDNRWNGEYRNGGNLNRRNGGMHPGNPNRMNGGPDRMNGGPNRMIGRFANTNRRHEGPDRMPPRFPSRLPPRNHHRPTTVHPNPNPTEPSKVYTTSLDSPDKPLLNPRHPRNLHQEPPQYT